MTDFTLGVLGIGAVFIAIVVIFNIWQTKKLARTTRLYTPLPDTTTPVSELDAQPDTQREPVFIHNDTVPTVALGEMTLAEPNTVIQVFSEEGINPLIDAITPVTLEVERSGAQVQEAFAGLKKIGSKHVKLEGYNRTTHVWEAVIAQLSYLQLRIGLQIACRRGPLTTLEYSEFANRLQRATEPLNAFVDVPDMSAIILQAEKLDQLAAQYDLKISLNLVSDGAPWAATTVRHIAEQDRWMPISAARYAFVRENSLEEPLFFINVPEWLMSLKTRLSDVTQIFPADKQFDQPVQALSLILDVPRAAADLRPFEAMCTYAQTLVTRIGAHIVDDNGQPLSGEALNQIAAQLTERYETMQAHGIVAGSHLARRLYAL